MAGVKRRTGKRSKPAQNKNGCCLYYSSNYIVPEIHFIYTFYIFDFLYIKGDIISSNRTSMQKRGLTIQHV